MAALPDRPGRAALVLTLLAAAWRLVVLVRTDFAIDGDEGTVGLMALHIARLQELPVFFYGQSYMGALEAYAAALPMAVLGPSAVALKLTGLGFALATVLIGWALARRVLGGTAGFVAGLYLAVPPMVLTVWSLKMRGGYTSLLALGGAVLLVAHVIAERGATLRNSGGFGLLAGTATWLNLLAFPFVGGALLFLLSRRVLVTRAGTALAALAGFVLGAAPLLGANLVSGGETLRFLARRGAELRGDPLHAFLLHPRQLLGMVAPWPDAGAAPAWAPVVGLLVLAGLVTFLVRERRSLADFLRFGGRTTSGAELYALLGVLYLGCASLSGFGASPSPRFAIVLYPVIAVAVAALVAPGLESRTAGARAAAVLVVAGLLAHNVDSLWRHFDGVDGTYSGEEYGPYRHGATVEGCLELLEELGVDGLAADHWIRHVVAFESGDRIVPSPARYGPHADRFRRAERIAWSSYAGSPDAKWMDPRLDRLAAAGVRHDAYEVAGQRFAVLRDAGLPARDWTADSNSSPDKAHLAVDRDPRTNWKAYERPLDATEPPSLTVDLGDVHMVGRVGFVFSHPEPRRVGMQTSRDGRLWSIPWVLTPGDECWTATFRPVDTRFVRLSALSKDDMGWELVELFVYEE